MAEIEKEKVMTIEVTILIPITNGERISPKNNMATMKINKNPKDKFCCKLEWYNPTIPSGYGLY